MEKLDEQIHKWTSGAAHATSTTQTKVIERELSYVALVEEQETWINK